MKIKVVLTRPTLDLLWALSDPARRWSPSETPLGDDEAIVELDEDVVPEAMDLFDADTFDEVIRRLAHVKLAGGEEASP